MFAVIETGGKQYKVQNGDVIYVEKLAAEDNSEISFQVVALGGEDGLKVGTPYVDGASVTGKVLKTGKGKKITVFTYKPKKGSKRKMGHRQPYTMVKIESLTGAAPKKAAAPKAEKAVVEEKAEAKPAKKVSASMKKDELIAFAKENNIAIDEKATKAVIIEAIEAALK